MDFFVSVLPELAIPFLVCGENNLEEVNEIDCGRCFFYFKFCFFVKEWSHQQADKCPKYGVNSRLLIPQHLSPRKEKFLEFGFDEHHQTARILIYQPLAKQVVKHIDFFFDYDGDTILRVYHRVSYEAGDSMNRVMLSVAYHWIEYHEKDVLSAKLFILAGYFFVGSLLLFVITGDEFLRYKTFYDSKEKITSHPSSLSPVALKRANSPVKFINEEGKKDE